MFGVADRLGTHRSRAHRQSRRRQRRSLCDEDARVLTTWVDGKFYDTDAAANRDPRGTWEVTAEGKTLPLTIEGELEKLEAKLGGEKVTFSTKDDAVLLIAPAKLFDKGEGSIRLSGRIAARRSAEAVTRLTRSSSLERKANRALCRDKEAGRKTIAAR